jgi:hypothetical protein
MSSADRPHPYKSRSPFCDAVRGAVENRPLQRGAQAQLDATMVNNAVLSRLHLA